MDFRDVVSGELHESSVGDHPKLREKGLLTPDNCVVALIGFRLPLSIDGLETSANE
jgi:hypothetical protein